MAENRRPKLVSLGPLSPSAREDRVLLYFSDRAEAARKGSDGQSERVHTTDLMRRFGLIGLEVADGLVSSGMIAAIGDSVFTLTHASRLRVARLRKERHAEGHDRCE